MFRGVLSLCRATSGAGLAIAGIGCVGFRSEAMRVSTFNATLDVLDCARFGAVRRLNIEREPFVDFGSLYGSLAAAPCEL